MSTGNLARVWVLGVLWLLANAGAQAADYYVTPKGAGVHNGASWNDAFPFAAMSDVLNRTMKPGDTVHLEGAKYGRVQIIIDSSGEPGAPKTIIGEDRGNGMPLLGPSNEEWMNWKEYGVLFKARSSHWVVKNIAFRMYAEPTVCTEGGHANLILENLRVERAYTGFKLVDCHDSVLRNCTASRYSQEGFLFLKHCERVLIKECRAEGSPDGMPTGDVDQVGYQCNRSKAPADDGNTHLTFEDCVARNNLNSDHQQHWVQGDGFVAEGADRHLVFRRCRSLGASDGCFDLKAQIDEFVDCVAIGPARCFKLWAQQMTITNCIAILTPPARYRTTGTICALEVNNRSRNAVLDGHIIADHCTFHIVGGGPGFWGESGKATLRDCIVSFTAVEADKIAHPPAERDVTVTYERTVIDRGASDTSAPKYVKPLADWDGRGDNYDSQTYGTTRGYHSSRITRDKAPAAPDPLKPAAGQAPATAPAPAASMNLANVRRDVLAWCESIRDADAPYGQYRKAPGQRCDLYAACDVAILRAIMGEDFSKTLDQRQRRQWIDHINSFQQREDGHYEDTHGHSRLHANGMVIGALGVLGGRQKYTVKLYEPFDTPEKLERWLDQTVDWKAQWSGSHLFWGGMHCFSLSRACTPAWRQRAFAWLDANLDKETGWWRKGVSHKDRHQPLGGSVHILPIYQHHGQKFPLPQRVIDSVLAMQLPSGRWLETRDVNVMHYLELDALYALRYMGSLAPDHRAADVRAAVEKYAALVCRQWPITRDKLFAGHPHQVLAAVGTFGLLQQFGPDRFPDDRRWSDIFSDLRFYRTAEVEAE